MQITNSFINKHCERIKCSAYAAPIKEARLQGLQRVASGKRQGDRGKGIGARGYGHEDSYKCALALFTCLN